MGKYRTNGAAAFSTIVSTADIKSHLRVDHAVEDDLIGGLRDAACEWVEEYCSCVLGTRTGAVYLNEWATAAINAHPINSVSGVTYKDVDGGQQSLLAADYHLDSIGRPGYIRFVTSPSPVLESKAFNRVTVTLSMGWAAADVPPGIIAAIKLITGHWYEHRQEEIRGGISRRIQFGAAALLSPHRLLVGV